MDSDAAGAHLRRILEGNEKGAAALDVGLLAKAAECSPGLLRRALVQPALLSVLQWSAMEMACGCRTGWLGSGESWAARYSASLAASTRGKALSGPMQLVRRDNLRRLCKAAGKWVVLARVLNTPPTLLSNLAAADSRPFGPARARSIEARLELPEGWMDRQDPVPQQLAARLQGAVNTSAAPASQPAQAPSPACVPGGEGLAPLHQAVLQKYAELARAGALSESFAHGLLGQLLERETASA